MYLLSFSFYIIFYVTRQSLIIKPCEFELKNTCLEGKQLGGLFVVAVLVINVEIEHAKGSKLRSKIYGNEFLFCL